METTHIDYYGVSCMVEHFPDGEIDTVYVNGVDVGILIGRQQLEELEDILKRTLADKAEQTAMDYADWCYHDRKDR